MSQINESAVDTKLLRLLIAVVDAGSVTAAAEQLGVTQSAVSHQLGRLRALTGHDLFVKSGRGIAATQQARALALEARELLQRLEAFARTADFDPARWRTTFTIAANDFQREVLLPALAARLRDAAPGVALSIVASDVPTLETLRDGPCDLVISPRPPDGTDILQKRLFEDRWRVFYDRRVRRAPASAAAYLEADHVTVVYEARRALELDGALAARGLKRRFAVMVPGFGAVASFLRGSPMLATAPARLASGLLREFASIEPPVPCPRLPMYMIWHARTHHDAAHRWMRQQLEAVVPAAA